MATLTTAIVLLSLQVLAGRGLFAIGCLAGRMRSSRPSGSHHGRGPEPLADAVACMGGTTLAALLVLGLHVILQLVGWGSREHAFEPVTLGFWGLSVLAGAPATAGIFLVLRAGHDESRGQLQRARRRVRLGGQSMFVGSAAWVIVLGAALVAAPGATRSELLRDAPTVFLIVGSVMGLGLGGFIGLLAGLSGKPRPSGPIAALVFLAGVLATVAAARPVPPANMTSTPGHDSVRVKTIDHRGET